MSLESDINDALAPLVGGRAYPDTFEQNQQWPAIRYTFVSATPDSTICGSGGDGETDFRVQIDVVSRNPNQRDSIRLAVQGAMKDFTLPNTLESWAKEYDTESKAYRAVMDFIIQPSSA